MSPSRLDLDDSASHGKDRELIAQAISDHARSLLVDHLLDVSSSDPDSVKPWFLGKIDYSPPVVNLTEGGYKLVGGRLDILENRQVAAIVYKHQDRFITVFVWPAANHAIDFDSQFFQGFNLCGWNKSGLNYLIVSELSQADMEKFEDQLRERTEQFTGESHLPVNDARIDSAKSECVAKHVRQLFFAKLVGNHIQITRWIEGLVIQSRWN